MLSIFNSHQKNQKKPGLVLDHLDISGSIHFLGPENDGRWLR